MCLPFQLVQLFGRLGLRVEGPSGYGMESDRDNYFHVVGGAWNLVLSQLYVLLDRWIDGVYYCRDDLSQRAPGAVVGRLDHDMSM